MSKKSKILLGAYIIFLIVFIIYFLTANKIEYFFAPKECKFEKVDFSTIEGTSPVYYAFDSLDLGVGSFKEYCYFSGWAYCPTGSENSGKHIDLIFKNVDSDDAYMYKTKKVMRKDIYDKAHADTGVYNSDSGFFSKISYVALPDGNYEFYINVFENEYDHGAVSTKKYFRKSISSISEIPIKEVTSRSVNISVENTAGLGKGAIDFAGIKDECFYVCGWAFFSHDQIGDSVYVGLTDENGVTEYYPTDTVNRPDLVKGFKDEKYLGCGYSVYISSEKFEQTVSISLVSEVEGKYYLLNDVYRPDN